LRFPKTTRLSPRPGVHKASLSNQSFSSIASYRNCTAIFLPTGFAIHSVYKASCTVFIHILAPLLSVLQLPQFLLHGCWVQAHHYLHAALRLSPVPSVLDEEIPPVAPKNSKIPARLLLLRIQLRQHALVDFNGASSSIAATGGLGLHWSAASPAISTVQPRASPTELPTCKTRHLAPSVGRCVGGITTPHAKGRLRIKKQ
jgi:hypothetical protein